MSAVDTWPLSAAATQLLIDLRNDGPAGTLNTTLSQLTVKELMHRGHLRVLEVRTRWMGTAAVQVAFTAPTAEQPLPLTAATLAKHLAETASDDLGELLREARRSNHALFHHDLRAAAYGELTHHGLCQQRIRRSFGIWPTSFIGATSAGNELRRQAQAAAKQGTLALLAPGGLAAALPGLGADLGTLEATLERITTGIDKNAKHAVDLHNASGGGGIADGHSGSVGGCGGSSSGGGSGCSGGGGGGGCGGGGGG